MSLFKRKKSNKYIDTRDIEALLYGWAVFSQKPSQYKYSDSKPEVRTDCFWFHTEQDMQASHDVCTQDGYEYTFNCENCDKFICNSRAQQAVRDFQKGNK